MKEILAGSEDDRALSAAVSHVLALGITAVLISGLVLSAGTVLETQREEAARNELETIGNRLASELTRASTLANEGANVSIQTRQPNRVGGESYRVSLLTGSDCDTPTFDTDACLSLEVQDGSTAVMVPVRNATGVELRKGGSGRFSITAVANDSTPSPSTATVDRNLRVGVGQDLGEYGSGSLVNTTNREPISGFTFTPGQPTVDSSIHFENDTKDLDGRIVEYEWDLGDGTTETGRELNHSYSTPGKYTVTLTVTDEDGATDNVSKVVSVGGLVYNYDASGNSMGEVTLSVGNKHTSAVEIREVLIDPEDDNIDELNASSPDSEIGIDGDNEQGGYDGAADIYPGGRIFDLEDRGGTNGEGYARLSASSDADVDLIGFMESGSFADMDGEPVRVAMRYEVGGQFYTTKFTLFGGGPSNEPPEPDFDVINCDDDTLECEFDPDDSDDDDDIDTYHWDFDDGNTTTETSDGTVTNTFPANGTYDVSLTVTDTDGVSSTLTKSVKVGGSTPVVVLAVNAGGETHSTDGITYEEDALPPSWCPPWYDWGPCATSPHPFFVGPQNEAQSTGDSISGGDDALHQNLRYGDFGYEIPVPNGDYEVTFEFAEIWATSSGERQFGVKMEGTEVISGFDIYDEVGHDVAMQENRSTTVSDGTLDIDFETEVGAARVNAIVVTRTDAEAYEENENVSERVVMEAENHMLVVPGNAQNAAGEDMSSNSWETFSEAAASDSIALEAQPNIGRNAQDTRNGERLDYFVNFTNTGTYEVWARMDCPGGGADSIHAGLDGEPQSYGDVGMTSNGGVPCRTQSGWTWVSDADGDQVTVDVSESGLHTFNLWMREDGTRVDKVILKKSGSDPSGTGPSETPLG